MAEIEAITVSLMALQDGDKVKAEIRRLERETMKDRG